MSEGGCGGYRHFSWLPKACMPSNNDTSSILPAKPSAVSGSRTISAISILPDDLLLECLSRVPSSCLVSISLVCRRWCRLLTLPDFLSLRRLRSLLLPAIFVFSSSPTNCTLLVSSLSTLDGPWKVGPFIPFKSGMPTDVSHSRLSAIGPRVYIIGRDETLCYDSWSGALTARCPMLFPPRKFAAAVALGKIYVAGGADLQEYDPERDVWRVVSRSPRIRYSCTAAAVDGVVYVIGGLKVGSSEAPRVAAAGADSRAYAASMDVYDVEASAWLRSRAVPGGGCAVAACASAGYLYVLASHAVELSFWRFDGRRRGNGFGDWCKLRSPPLGAQTRLDSRVRFTCVVVEAKVVLIQVNGSIDDLLRRSGRTARGLKEGLVLIYDLVADEWTRGPDLPDLVQRAACVCVEI